jgi:autotransporter-associated beta strand protein
LGSGTLNVGAASASPAAAPGTLNAKDVIFSTGSPGTVNFNHTSTNYVFAPQITGAGPGVVNIIAGTTIFTADDTYAGNTTISPGATLQLGNAGATGSISGNATDNGAMIFDRTTAFTYAGSVSGSGNLTQAGAGTLTLHGNSTYSGGTIIDSGDTLALGDLFGDGSIVGAVNDQGSLIFFRTANLNFAGNISGAGNLTKQGAGNLTLSGNDTYSGATTISTGRLIASGGSAIGDLSSVAIAGAGALEVASSETIGALSGFGNVTLDSGAVLTTGHNGLDSTYSGNIAGAGNLTKAGVGNFTLGGADTYSGATTVAGGDLFVNGNLASPTISVQSAAALGGTGNLAGAVTVANGGTLIGRAGSVLTMSSLALNPTSNINVSLGAPSTSGLFQVDGALTLDGNLNITDAGGFGAGTYRIITYTGALTDNGLSIGIAPAGNLTVQTSIADQVNLIFTAPTLGSIEFWNGTTTSPTGTVVGGAGTWIIGPTNWTDAAGDTSGNWAGGMAIFEGAPGAVTIDDSAGSIQATDIQFAVDGYSVGGGNLTLAGGAPTIRVGDGSSAGAGYTATISAPILGTGGLIKTDLGTLVLSATNTYTGGTTIEGGTLSVGADANLGGAGNLTLDGGNLTVTGSFASARTVDVEAAGGINVGSGDTLNLTGNLTDSAALTKSGAGVLEISGAGAYAGALGVAAGALEVNGSLGAATVTVQSGATLAGSGTLGGPVIVANGGHLVGVEGQTLTMGALTLNPTSNLDVSLGAPSSTQLFQVNGALTLDGTLNITDAGGFGAGTYRLIDYTGALTDNGLSLGTAPAGNLTVQTSVANQVNLVFATAGSGPLQFWNGTTTSPTGTVVAGNGTWRIGPTNWTDAAGDASGAWTGGFAIFQATPGTVTIDNSTGAIDATGLQFAVSGYTVAGGALTLAGATPTIRVGDSSAAGAGYTATISAPIAGTGGLVKTDLGTLVLTGASSLSGGSTVAAGRLAVEGSLANSAVTVADGATLGGNGVVGGVIAQAGALVAPGDSIGALGVSGNYAQAAGSTYQVELDAAGHADRINVSGAASLAGGAVLDVIKTDSAPYVFGTRYTVLSAAGGVTGTYTLTGDTIPVTPFIGLVVDYDADDVYLDVGKIRSFASAGATPNEIAAGRAADDLPLANDLANVLANLPTIGAAHAAFNQVSGEIHASVRGAMLEDGRTLRDGVIDHLIILADGDPGVWGEAVTGSRRLNGDGNAAAAQGSDTTLMAGLDNALGPVILGVVGGYETGGLGVEARASSANLQGWHVAAYGQADLGGGWGLRGVGGYSGWTADISRMVSLPGLSNRLSSRDSAGEGQAYAELGWTAHLGAARVQPFIGAGWSWLQGSSFAERGGAAALNGRGLALDIGSGKAGVRLDAEWRGGGVTIRPHAALAWELGFDGRLPLVDVGFPDSVSGAAYAVSGPTLWRDRADVDLGVDLSKGGFTLGAGFIGQYADRASQEGFNAHVDWDF